MTAKVVQFKQIGPVTFIKNRRSKNIKISVKPDKSVHVSFPFYASSSEISQFVMKSINWITEQQQKFETKKSKIKPCQFQTKLHSISIIEGTENKTKVNFNDIEIKLADFDLDSSRSYLENVMVGIYRFEARKILPPRLIELAQKHGFQVNKINIRNNKRNWGSCSARNNISLNLQMMKLPDELIDYILLHELVHTKIKNHGLLFWQKLDELTGSKARELSKQVRRYSTYFNA
ncbi:MAG TPA: SprT family zinc-dependent metalloprotease [Draconibacterium sp.]|nr:SprT family zinc-dependent metalloprotease [Draconibacterium sp.]